MTPERQTQRELNRKHIMDIITRKVIIEVTPDHSNILPRQQSDTSGYSAHKANKEAENKVRTEWEKNR